uniref:Tyrosinase copper-binding domain-containing protein n=1 Tax=Portulaca oleracea TaxID=46147 RepID=I4DD56_POROL|nr:hypothetical protein [Portulaca oleracea]
MASLSPIATSTTNTTTAISATPNNPLFSKASQLSAYKTKPRHVPLKISCNAAKKDDQQNPNEQHVLDRRNMLLGLGGLYGAAATFGVAPASLAKPTAPAITQCSPDSEELPANVKVNCCPPMSNNILDFKPSNSSRITRIRPAAHLVDTKYLEKYHKAISLMKALPDSDPRSFTQQANVHCAYCNGAYHQVGFPKIDLQVHGSWLFFPFHRAYLYFYEKILGSLINDPTFAIPYWNWDHPDGMTLPAIFADPKSTLYDPVRDSVHTPMVALDLSYDGTDHDVPKDQQIKTNLTVMYRQMVSNAKNSGLFMGQPYRAGDTGSKPGSLETMPHGPVHIWVGKKTPNREDMGNFYSAARDPIFYAHHGNVDRMWSVWRTLGPKNKNFKDSDFLDSSFVFYDENAKAVRIRVRDVLDTKKLGYEYQPVDLPWLKSRPTPRRAKVKAVFNKVKDAVAAEPSTMDVPTVAFPKPLDKVIRTHLMRPQKSRTKRAKDDEEEVLVIEVESKAHEFSKFDVYVNDEDEYLTKENRVRTEYAGSFVNVPHKHKTGGKEHKMNTTLRFGLTDLIEDLGADDDEGIDVILVPRVGTESVVIKSVKIELD